MAWQTFEKNGDPTFERFATRIKEYRRRLSAGSEHAELISCLVVRDAVFLPQLRWIRWGEKRGWASNVVSYKSYDLRQHLGQALPSLVAGVHAMSVPDLAPNFVPAAADERTRVIAESIRREGQGAFRLRMLATYGWQCAVTREHAIPVLEAAHIQPYLGPASNHVQNGLVLRADLHRLYDTGYLTVTPELKLEVAVG